MPSVGLWRFRRLLVVAISDANISFAFPVPGDAYAGYRLHSDGTIDGTAATSLNWANNLGTWLVNGLNSDFEVRATLNSGALDAASSATGSWLVLSTARLWYCFRDGVFGAGQQVANLTIEIRDASTLGVLDTATITLSATVTP